MTKDTLSRSFVAHSAIRCSCLFPPSLPLSLYKIKPKCYIYIYIYSLTFTNFIFHTAGTWFHRRATSFVQLAAVYVGGPYYKALHYANSSRISVRRDRYPFVPFYPLLSSALSSSSPKRKRARAPRLKARNP